MQAVLSAVGGFYTWKLASRIYGEDSRGAWATQLVATIISPWQWFCSTRTLSNCLETTLTIVALDQWPWQWSANTIADGSCGENDNEMTKVNDTQLLWRYDLTKAIFPETATDAQTSLRQCLLLAAVACILRPTKIIIWTSLAAVTLIRGTWHQRKRLVREVLLCGSVLSL
ncbi:hypothetical protein N7454_000578 [Penicillium verhagenii]|nr:hypothetical protein N7454_000578 [Penicillium verhagenii]